MNRFCQRVGWVGLCLALPAMAGAEVPVDEPSERDAALHARLLGPVSEDPVEVSANAGVSAGPAETSALSVNWMVGLGALALCLAGVRKPLLAAVQPGPAEDPVLTVVARERLGGLGGAGGLLTLLDVQDASGETRRLLVGSGTQGPQLVADLSVFADGTFPQTLDALDRAPEPEEA